jgi:hypothetical protein
LSAYSGNSTIRIIIKLPNIASDPNYYTTFDIENSYYQYKTYLVEYKVVSSDVWLSIPEITIPANSYAGQDTTANITGLLNDTTDISGTSYNIRVKLSIKNNDNSQIAYSRYTYLTNVNNILYTENINNVAYASLFPTKPSVVSSLNIWKISAANNQIGMTWTTPINNGNAAFYSLNTTTWYNVYDVTNGIAINTGTNLAGPSSSTTNISTLITFTLTSTSNIQRYSLRLRVTGYNTVDGVGNPVLNPILTRQAISDWSDFATIIL